MTVPRLVAIMMIFVVATGAWLVLGASVDYRTGWAGDRGHDAVGDLWGLPQTQLAPVFRHSGTEHAPLDIVGTGITVDFELEQRKKGLLWYATYVVDFSAAYRIRNGGTEASRVEMEFTFPEGSGVYDAFAIAVGGSEVPVRYEAGRAHAGFEIPAGGTVTVTTGYRTNGLGEWRYVPSPGGVGVVENFSLLMTTDFTEIDFPGDAVSPTRKDASGDGWSLMWEYDSLVSGRPIALTMPTPLNPGPVAMRISFFAPVSLLFYFAALVLLTATKDVRVHPVNYAFLAAGFFVFHLLFAYLVDRIDIYAAFAVASVTSVALCVGYLRMVLGSRKALAEIAVGQLVFLVLFSYSFFFEGLTGLAVTIGSVLTLAYFMVKTGHVDWEKVFQGKVTYPAAVSSTPVQ